MKPESTLRATFLSIAISLVLAGCSGDDNEMSQEEIQYISHLDQSRFFQRQGELKASTREARSAIEMQPGRPDPYLVIIDNLLTAGDAQNAERQLEGFLESVPDEAMTQALKSDAQLIFAEANLMQGEFDEALAALDKLESPDRAQQQEAAILKGRIMLAMEQPGKAQDAFENANSISASARAQVGLSRAAWQLGQEQAIQDRIAKAEEIDPNSPELWLWKAWIAEQSGDWAAAEEAYIQALEDIGRYDIMTFRKYETMSALIRVLREQGKSSEAFVYEEILAKSAPGTIKSNFIAAKEAYENGDVNDAARYLEEILAQAPGNEQASLLLGLARFRQGRVEEAEKLLAPIAELGESELASKLVAASRLQLRDPVGAQKILENLDSANTDPSVLAMVGVASLSTGNVEVGEELLQKSLTLAPENHNLRSRYVRYLIASDQIDKAFQQIEALKKNGGDANLVKPLSIEAHLAGNNRNQATAMADQWIAEMPDNLNALMARGQIAAQDGNFKAAADYFNRAAAAHEDNPSPLVALARVALAEDQIDLAKQRFNQAAMLSPNNMQALQGMASVYPAEELKQQMETLVEQHPSATAPKLILLEIALSNGDQDYADKLSADLLDRESPESPAEASPAVARIYNGVGAKLRRSDNTDAARKVLQRGRILFPEDENIALQSASLAFSQDEAEQARRILQEVKQLHDQSARPYIVEADYFSSNEQYQQAAELYQLAIEKGAGPDVKLALARSFARANRMEKALEVLEAANQNHPNNQALLVNTAMLHQQDGSTAEAMKAYERVLDAFPNNPLALNNLAWMYFEEGDDRASELSAKAYSLSPESAAIADTHGWILFKAGDTKASLPILEKAHKLAPDSQEIALHLAEAYRAAGMNDEAKATLEKFENEGTD
ncbi:tetratricopeptide repeat protein [Marinobacter sp. CHS3-4]|uniref:tetratricopeptide repeat protein n=1 Tax=Marinobacter sp. CHS3-4 TaxID=3045174 RepID=UPI0024B5D539|nr:tetratricopeptide repeat protein [Marinobacter sp. CHS3-4]MDI9245562.1 tetratricopeptide repeat protein [Marinobacter sp. CHS3-4]